MKKPTTYRFTEGTERWLAEQAKLQGISKNALTQIIINKAIAEQQTDEKGTANHDIKFNAKAI